MRDADATVLAAAGAQQVRPVVLTSLDWPSGIVRLCSAPFNVTDDGAIYLGVGDLGSIGAVEEGPEVRSYGVVLTITGIRPEYLSEVTSAPIQGRPCFIWLALLDSEHRVIGTPVQVFGGRMDFATVEVGQICTITVTAESHLVDWERPRVRRFTHEDQTAAFPGDLGLAYVAAMADLELIWGT